MAAPRRKAPEPEPRLPVWLQRTLIWAAAVPVIAAAGGYGCEWYRTGERIVNGAEKAHVIAPQVEKLNTIVEQQVQITEKQDQRISLSEKGINEIRKLKESEQERLQITRDYQKTACSEGKLDRDLCRSLSFPFLGED